MVKIILIKSPDEWATTKQVCRDELVVYLSFSSHNIYIYILFFSIYILARTSAWGFFSFFLRYYCCFLLFFNSILYSLLN